MYPIGAIQKTRSKYRFKTVVANTDNKLSRVQLLFCCFLLCTFSINKVNAETVYFDGEDGSVGQWRHYAGNESPRLIENTADDDLSSRVIQIQGADLNQGSLLGGLNQKTGWSNDREFSLSWLMSADSSYLIEIPVTTLAGDRYLVYQANPPSNKLFGRYLYWWLGADTLDGQWMQQIRDLEEDVENAEPGNRLLSVNGMIFRGSGKLDDIRLSAVASAAIVTAKLATGKVLTAASTSSEIDVEVNEFKIIYKALSVAKLMVLAEDGDRFANLELSLRHAMGSGGAPYSQSASIRQYIMAANRANFIDPSGSLPIDRFGVPAIRIDRSGSNATSVASPQAILELSTTLGEAPLTLTADASRSSSHNGSLLWAWSDSSVDSNTPSFFLGSTPNIALNYSNTGEYAVRLLVMDDRGIIRRETKTVNVDAPRVASEPTAAVLQLDAAGLLNELKWRTDGSPDNYDIRLLSSTGAVLNSLSGLVASTNCVGTSCVIALPVDWVIENGSTLQIRSYDGSAVSAWISSGIAPLADAGPDRGHVQGASIVISGGNSIDRDGNIDAYQWRQNGTLLGQSANVSLALPVGSHTIELTVLDNSGLSSSDEMQVSVFAKSNISIGNNVGDVEKILDALTVSTSQINTQMTPLATADGYVYTANIEHGPNGDEDGVTLHTVVRKGRQNTNGSWSWESVLVEDRTVFDQWHTAPSIEIDKDGQVHVVYNMHNIPWQYKRTSQPHDIQSFEFHGQYVSQEQIDLWKFNNSTSFPSFGFAEIPGTQITYPRFEKDPNGELYLTYRFASRPKRSWPERTFATGLAEYSRAEQSWTAIGEPLNVTSADFDFHPDAPLTSTAFAAKTGWTAYHPSMVFDNQSGIGVLMLWRSGTAGASTSKPCFAWSDNKLDFETLEGVSLALPLQPEECSNLGYSDSKSFYNVADSEMDSQGNIYLTLSPTDSSSLLLSYSASTGQWKEEESPSGASEIFVDMEDNLWAVSSGPKVHKRTSSTGAWQEIYSYSGARQCYPRAVVSGDGSTAFIYTLDCNWENVSVYGLRLKP